MEKLLKLINEYEEEWIIFDEVDDEECFVDIHPCTLWTEYNWHLWFNNANKVQFDKWMFDKIAISKEYGFVEWLIEQDKINMEKVPMRCELYYQTRWIPWNVTDDTDILIMLLAIQPKPIEFLIELLK